MCTYYIHRGLPCMLCLINVVVCVVNVMGFVGLRFHNASASTAVRHMSLKKFQNLFSGNTIIKSVRISSKAHIDFIDFYDEGEGRPFLSSFLRLQTSCSFETIPKAAHREVWIFGHTL